VFAYIPQSLILVQYHENPMIIAPAAFGHDPLMALASNWAVTSAPYGPLGVIFDALPTFVAGRHVLANLLLLKFLFSGMMIASAYLVYRLLRIVRPSAALTGALLLAWNPLLIFEIGANGHNDAAMIFFALLALLMAAEGDLLLAVLMMTVSLLVKYETAPLLPLLLAYGVSRYDRWWPRARYLGLSGAIILGVMAISYAPFWDGIYTIQRTLYENQFYLYSFSSVLTDIVPSLPIDTATLIGRVLFVPLYLYALVMSWRGLPSLLTASLLAAVAFLALAVNDVKYWYLALPVALSAAVPGTRARIALVVAALGVEVVAVFTNIYVWVWQGVTYANFVHLNEIGYLAIFVAPVLVTAVLVLKARVKGRRFQLSVAPEPAP
ncbi:MAG: hypothetical protein ACRDFS_09105, partial [Chloroflexota bacterium]